jgi:catechol 2,3-dioxygenase-like lactoylglutathione lyase family enzyme
MRLKTPRFFCKDLDESEQFYTTSIEPLYKGCDYVTLF